MTRSIYLNWLDNFSKQCELMPNTRLSAFLKVYHLVLITMRYEKIEFDQNLQEHPFQTVATIIDDTLVSLKSSWEVEYIEDDDKSFKAVKSHRPEVKHAGLWTQQWPRYVGELMEGYIARYLHRINVNSLEPYIAGRRVLDMGCGNGAFLFACLEAGADSVVGIDFGKESIDHAKAIAKHRNVSDRSEFLVSTVYDVPFADEEFDFVIQNGVFHHVEHPDKAIREAARLLKKGGAMWYYVDGEGAIKSDLFNAAVYILRDVPTDCIISVLKTMNLSEPKIAFLNDGFGATYSFTTWDKLTAQLSSFGFMDFKRMVGGFATDFDHDVIEADPYGKEKFGEGNLRLLARLG